MRCRGLAILLLSAATLGGCGGGVLDPKGPIASSERLILLNSTGIMLAIVIPTMLATLAVAFWFRSSNTRATYLPEFNYSGRLEMLVWSIPIMTVLLVGGVAWVNHLTVPVGTPISFELTSSGVMNSFFVPQLGGQIYTMAGMVTRLHLLADHTGTYRGMSANYSGAGFSDMHFSVDAVPAERFAQWVAETRGAEPVLDEHAYADLVKPTEAVTPFTYRAVTPDLFSSILSGGKPPNEPSSMTHRM